MAERVHPRDSPPVSEEHAVVKPQSPPSEKPVPPPGTYVIKIPKDIIHRVPPPENARRYEQYTRKSQRRNRRCCCFCWFIGIIFILIVLLGITAGIFYLVFRPKAPNYSIENINIRGINLTSPSSTAAISPEFDVTVKSDNPNNKIGISYLKDSSAEIFYKDVRLCNGVLPAFYQPSNNVTVFKTVLKGNGIKMRSEDLRAMVTAQSKRKVPLMVKLRAPVKIKVGLVKTWKITVKVDCDLTVDRLMVDAKIVTKDCNFSVDLW
ncbi:protein NDR1-like [Trifolium pratense]|uniref:Protein NDR1-like n=1 Tax=Trifolium pratense TaxID=57577 RepID=A0A2K3LGX6_TRIPR|nr:protein NDR1-like [Trifolium pratense]